MEPAALLVGASGLLGEISRLRLAPRQNAILNDAAPLVLAPFHEIVSRGQEALANAGDSQPMREAAQSLVKEGERAIRKIEPLVKKYITEYDVNFHMALKENDDIAEYRSQLYELLWDIDDYIESAEYFDDHKFSELRAASKEAAIKIYDILGSLKLDAPEEHVLPFAPLPQTTAFPSSNRSTAFSNSVQTGLLEPVWSPVPTITQDSNTYTLEDGTNQPQRLMAFHDDFYQGLEPDPIIQPLPACDPSTVPSNYRYDLNLLLDGNEKAPSAEAASQKGSKVSRGEPDSLIDAAVPFAPTVPWSHSAPSRSLRDMPSRGDKYGYSADTDSRSSLSSSSGFTGSSIKGGHYSAHSSRRGNRASSDYTFASTAISEEDAIHGTYSLTKADIPLSATSMEVSRGVLPWEKGGLISVAPDYLSGIIDPSSLQVQRCFLDAQSSYWLAKGFCDGAKEICGGGVGVKRVKKPTAFMASVTTARCVSCMYELDLSAVENDVNKTERASYSHAGILFRLRFLQKSHITTKKADDVQYGCVFCVQQGYTLDESDATIFFSYKALMDHIARHPRQGVLPVVPGITVIDEPEVPVSLRNDFDIHFTRPPEPHPAIERRSEISNLPTAVTQNQARRIYGQRALPDQTPALEFPIGARITGLTWPSTYNGQWAMGWYDGVKASVPTDLLRLKPPLSQFEQFGSESRIRAQAKWKFGFEKDKSSDWLRFEKNDVIKNIRWAYFDHWCWSGTNSKGKWGIFPQAFIDLNTLEEPAGLERALSLSIEKDRPTSLISRFKRRTLGVAQQGPQRHRRIMPGGAGISTQQRSSHSATASQKQHLVPPRRPVSPQGEFPSSGAEHSQVDNMMSVRRLIMQDSKSPETGHFQRKFRIDWNLQDVFTQNYEAGTRQDVSSVVSLTGSMQNAQLCSVGEYFRQTWPQESSTLLGTLKRALRVMPVTIQGNRSNEGFLAFEDNCRIAIVKGPEDFVICIAQQLVWLAAVLTEKGSSMKYASSTLTRNSSDGTYGTYNITVTLRDPPAGDSTSCWNSIAGPAILVQGFPHPARVSGETGLEITAASMAAIAGIPRAVVFGGGVVFKARCHALVPVEERGDSVQWHLIDKYPEKLEWSDIDELCPHRLKEDFVTEEWWKRRAFLGLAPQFANLLATESYEYEAVTYSSAGRPPRRVQINKISPGFSQWAQLSIEITVGKLDGYRAQRRGDYETLLKDARDIHIILHDTASDRAYQTDGEELILHTILHRWLKNGYDSNNVPSPDRPRFPDEHRFVSTRSAMLANAEWPALSRKVFDSSEARVFLFKEEVRTLYSTIEGLRAKFSEPEDSFWRFSLKTGTEVNGWEYMDLVEDRMDMSPKSIDLRNTCGGWDQYAKGIQAVVLFGANLGEVFRPCWSEPSDECQNFRSVPVDCCYLTVQMRTLRDIFRKQGCPDTQETLTESGLMLQSSPGLLKPCHQRCAGIESCSAQRLVRLVGKPVIARLQNPCLLPKTADGIIVIGKASPSRRLLSGRASSSQRAASRQDHYAGSTQSLGVMTGQTHSQVPAPSALACHTDFTATSVIHLNANLANHQYPSPAGSSLHPALNSSPKLTGRANGATEPSSSRMNQVASPYLDLDDPHGKAAGVRDVKGKGKEPVRPFTLHYPQVSTE